MWLLLHCVLLLLPLLLGQSRAQDLGREQCSHAARPVTLQPGAQALISALIGFSTSGQAGYGCGLPQTGNMQAYEAVRWALQRINQDQGTINGDPVYDSYIPGVKIGLTVQDTCSRPDVALQAVMGVYPEVYASPDQCVRNNSQIILGVLGPSYSATTQPVAELLTDFGVGQIAYAATATSLSDQAQFPYFMRTIPPDAKQIQVILELLKELQWSYIVVVYTDNLYGTEGYKGIIKGAANAGVCITSAIPVSSEESSRQAFSNILSQIVDTNVVGVVYFGVSAVARGLLAVGPTVPNAGRLQWIFSDSLGSDASTIQGLQYARGVITIAPTMRHIAEFEDYWVRIQETNPSTENPWLQDWYMNTNTCKLPGVNKSPYNSYPNCQLLSETQKRASYVQNQFVEPAIVAVYTFAHALKRARDAVCGRGSRGLCAGMFSTQSKDFFNRYLKTTDFTFTQAERVPTLASNQVQPYNAAKRVNFDNNGDIVNPGYSLWNYNNRGGSFKFENVGTYLNGRLDVSLNRIQVYNEDRIRALSTIPQSDCPSSGCSTCVVGAGGGVHHAYLPGDVVFGGIFSVHQAGSALLSCGGLRFTGGVDLVQAFIFATSNLPNAGILRQRQVGSLVIDDCSSAIQAQSLLASYYSGAISFSYSGGPSADPNQVYGFTAGSDDDITSSVAEVLLDLGVAQVGYNSGLDKIKLDMNYASVSPGYDAQSKALVLTAKQFGWQYLQVVTNDNIGSDFVESLRRAGMHEDVCVAAVHTVSTNPNYDDLLKNIRRASTTRIIVVHEGADTVTGLLTALRTANVTRQYVVLGTSAWGPNLNFVTASLRANAAGVLALQQAADNLDSFSSSLRSLDPTTYTDNPWFRSWYESVYECYIDEENLLGFTQQCTNVRGRPITAAPKYAQNPQVGNVMRAVTAMGRGLQQTIQQYCGSSSTSLCGQFRNAHDRDEVLQRHIQDAALNLPTRLDIKRISLLGREETIGQYQVNTDSFSLSTGNDLNGVTSSCGGMCTGCLYMYPQQSSMYIPGDLIIGGIFNVHEDGSSPFSCGDVRIVDGFQYSEAFAYALDQINKGAAPVKLNGITLGGFALDSCSSPLRAANLVSSIHSGALTFNAGNNSLDVNRIRGWISYTSSQSVQMADILSPLGIAHVSPSATSSELKDEVQYPTFFRTVPSDDRQTLAMAKLVQHMGWRFVQVVYSSNVYGRSGMESFKDNILNMDICILSSYEIGPDGSTEEIIAKLLASPTEVVVVFAETQDLRDLLTAKQKVGSSASDIIMVASETWGNSKSLVENLEAVADKALTFKINTPPVDTFTQYLTTKMPTQYTTNPWFREYYQAVLQCNLGNNAQYNRPCNNPDGTPVTDPAQYSQDPRILTTINGVYALTQALDLTLKEKCGGAYVGVCQDFLQSDDIASKIINHLEGATFTDPSGTTFKFLDREGDVGYTIFKYNQGSGYSEVGKYSDNNLEVADTRLVASYGDIATDCGDLCLQCQYNAQVQEQFTFTPLDQTPDIIIAGLFDIHKRSSNPFACGEINMEQGFQLLEAFNYAVNYVNEGKGIFAGKLQGVRLGALGLDTCQSATRAANLVVNIHSGTLPLRAGNRRVQPELIDVYVGGYNSDMSRRVAEVLNVLSIPQVSYGSTSTVFQDKAAFPYFMRTVPADDRQADAMVALLRRYGINYVQVVNSVGTYGEQAAEVFRKKADLNDICVAQAPITIQPGRTPEQAVEVLLRRPLATVVILFLDSPAHIKGFLEAVKLNPNARSLRFVGSETWAQNLAAIDGVEDVARSAVSLGVETADLSEFDEYLKDFQPGTSSNPWFDEFYQEIFKCSLAPGTSLYRQNCPDPPEEVVRARDYRQDPYVLYTVNAVFSVALGIDHALAKACGQSYYGMCASMSRSNILEGIREATFTDATRQMFKFNAKDESSRGYHIYSVEASLTPGVYFYKNVGSYNDTHGLKIDARYQLDRESTCSRQRACEECPRIGQRDNTRIMQTESDQSLNMIGFFNVHHADAQDPLRCGPMNVNFGFQNVLAYFFAMEQVNKRVGISLYRSLELGGLAIDTCSNSMRVSQDMFSLLRGEGLCGVADAEDLLNPSTAVAYLTMDNAATSAAVHFLSPRGVTTITPGANAVSLDDEDFLLRTTSPAQLQAQILSAITRQFLWPYVLAISSDDPYSKETYEAFAADAMGSDVISTTCVGTHMVLTPGATDEDVVTLLNQLSGKSGAKVVVLFTGPEDTRRILQVAQREGLQDKYIWIGDLSSPGLVDGLEDVARGAISLQVYSELVPGFYDYLEGLTFDNHGNIPDDWFDEFWQHTFRCRKEDSPVVQDQYNRQCDKTDRLQRHLLTQDPYVFHTVLSVYLVAAGLNAIEECQDSASGEVASCLARHGNKNMLIHNAIKGLELPVPPGAENATGTFSFDEEGYGVLGYTITTLKKTQDNPETYAFVPIGSWTRQNTLNLNTLSELHLNLSGHTFYNRDGSPMPKTPTSRCPSSGKCICVNTGKAGGGGGPDGDTGGVRYEGVSMNANFTITWGIIVAALTGLGILVTIFLFIYLLIFYPVRGGTTILGYMLLFGVLAIYILNFAFILHPNDPVCAIRRFCLGLVYAVCFAAMLVKVLNTWRLGSYYAEYAASYERLSHPCALFLIALALTLVQVIIGVQWLILRPPTSELVVYQGIQIPRCSPVDFHNEELIMSCIYVLVLVLLSLVFAALTWDSEENNQESRWILITACFTIAIWIVWTIISTLTEYRYRDPAIAIGNLVNATVILLCIYVRKIYLLNKYQNELEEEKRSAYSYNDEAKVYSNQAFDGTLNTTINSRKGSHAGSGVMYVYDGGARDERL